MGFIKDFTWGAATASYQIEGAAYEDGKGLNWWDTFCKEEGRIDNNDNGDIACDHYHRFEEDVKLMAEIGLKAYRFSISWARLIPNGTGEINPKGLEFYNRLIDALIENGVEPYITLYHWDMPIALAEKGAWQNPECKDWFAEYAKVVSENFSDRVTHFFTINEPQVIAGLGYESGQHAPGIKLNSKEILQLIHNILKAHGSAVIALRKYAKQPIKVGFAPCVNMNYPATNSPEDIEAARKSMFALGELGAISSGCIIWNDPIYFGKYPDGYFEKYKGYLPEITPEDMELISQPLDFEGQNTYWGSMIKASDNEDGFEFVKDAQGFSYSPYMWPKTPDSLYWGTKFLFERYGMPIIITENGMSSHDVVSEDGRVHDDNRIKFLNGYLSNLKRSAGEGNNIIGYFEWSLMDNFEWLYGYKERFGIIHVDYQTQKRTIKDSGYWYSEVIKSNGDILSL